MTLRTFVIVSIVLNVFIVPMVKNHDFVESLMEKIICEIATPQLSWQIEKVMEWTYHVTHILKKEKIFTVNLSEVIDEERGEKRNIDFHPKMDNIEFAELLIQTNPAIDLILCKITTHYPKHDFEEWVQKAYQKGFKKIVIVGAMNPDYSGNSYNVIQAAQYMKKKFPDIKIGGIIIFNRPLEHQKIIEKMQNGITFFLSQIVFESANLKKVMTELKQLCLQRNLPFPSIHVGIAPAKSVKDIEFLHWLGVEFPSAIYSHLTNHKNGTIEKDTFAVVERLIHEILDFSKTMQIPLGFNVEHIMYGNLALAERLISMVKTQISDF